MDFVCVDVETANRNTGSICQIGWSIVKQGELVDTQTQLIDPRCAFDPFNIDIHGITEPMVAGAPRFDDVKEDFRRLFNSLPVFSYGMFDKSAFARADTGDKSIPFNPDSVWINAQKIVRRAWPEEFRRKYNLRLVADTLGIELDHHDAGSDARAAAIAVIKAQDALNIGFDELLALGTPTPSRSSRTSGKISYMPAKSGPLSQETITFTGKLSISRRKAAEAANMRGAAVSPDPSPRTTVMVVGDGFPDAPLRKSAKFLQAEAMMDRGQHIGVISEQDFLRLVGRI